MKRRFWTEEELSFLKANYHKLPTKTIAAKLNRTVKAVQMAAKEYDFCKHYAGRKPGFDDFVRRKYALGWNDHEIASSWGCERHAVGRSRRRQGLFQTNSHQRMRQDLRDKVRERSAKQLAKAGLSSMGQIRVQAFRDYAVRHGWSADLKPRAVQILNALLHRGPLTRREIADAIGLPWIGSRRSLKSKEPGGSYLAGLMRRGLVVCLGKLVKGQGKGSSQSVYSLALDAVPNCSEGWGSNGEAIEVIGR